MGLFGSKPKVFDVDEIKKAQSHLFSTGSVIIEHQDEENQVDQNVKGYCYGGNPPSLESDVEKKMTDELRKLGLDKYLRSLTTKCHEKAAHMALPTYVCTTQAILIRK